MVGFNGYNYGYNQQPQPPQARPVCRWIEVSDYAEVQSMPIPADGTPTLFMMSDEPVFYIVSMMEGRKMVQGYCFTDLNTEAAPQQEIKKLTVEERLDKLEVLMGKLAVLVEGDELNESNIPEAKQKIKT